jgi:hypothetical protein
VEDYHVDVDYPGVEDDWIMGCPEETAVGIVRGWMIA